MKKLLALILVLFFPFTALASVQVATGRIAGHPTTAGVVTRNLSYNGWGGGTISDTNANVLFQVMPIAGTISKLRAVADYAPGGTETITAALYKNGAATALSCTMTGTDTTCSDSSNTVSVVQGDKVSYGITWSADVRYEVTAGSDFTPTTANETFVAGSLTSANTSIEQYSPFGSIGGQFGISGAGQIGRSLFFPETGVLDRFVASTTAPGAGKKWDITVMQNAATSSVTCQIDGDAPSWCADNVNTLTISVDDFVVPAYVPTGTPATTGAGFGARFVPSTAGDFLLPFQGANNDSNSVDNYRPVTGTGAPTATEASTTQVVNSMTVTSITAKATAAPGAGKSRLFRLRKNLANTDLTCTISGTDTSCTMSGSISVADGDLLDTVTTPSGTPAAALSAIVYVANRNATVSGRVIRLRGTVQLRGTVRLR